MADKIKTNRAPVLTLWGVIVAETPVYTHDEALTLGSSGRSHGLIQRPTPGYLYASRSQAWHRSSKKTKERSAGEAVIVEAVGRRGLTVQTEHRLQATANGEEI
jgi:hypothetical protein